MRQGRLEGSLDECRYPHVRPCPPRLLVLSTSGPTSNAKSSLLRWAIPRPGNEALLQWPLGTVPSLPQVLAPGPRLGKFSLGTEEAVGALA